MKIFLKPFQNLIGGKREGKNLNFNFILEKKTIKNSTNNFYLLKTQ
jgi:hypothetical protein